MRIDSTPIVGRAVSPLDIAVPLATTGIGAIVGGAIARHGSGMAIGAALGALAGVGIDAATTFPSRPPAPAVPDLPIPTAAAGPPVLLPARHKRQRRGTPGVATHENAKHNRGGRNVHTAGRASRRSAPARRGVPERPGDRVKHVDGHNYVVPKGWKLDHVGGAGGTYYVVPPGGRVDYEVSIVEEQNRMKGSR